MGLETLRVASTEGSLSVNEVKEKDASNEMYNTSGVVVIVVGFCGAIFSIGSASESEWNKMKNVKLD
ncbi:hypothetical protein AVEN_78267-1, partial [Araneus ventricosus]